MHKMIHKTMVINFLIFCSGVNLLHGNTHQINSESISGYERDLYLNPAGKYSESDILANGSKVRSEKFADFIPAHNLHPEIGDAICPITLTKANPKCTWIIGGKTYQFCCPPCIDEFLLLAKEYPEEINDPESYVKR